LETWILRLKIFPSILPFAVAFAMWHCQSGENPAQPDPDANPDAVSFGAFKIILREDGKTASFLGKIYDGPQPINTLWDEKLVAGCLKVVAPRLPFCAQPCGSGFACVADDSCQAYPTAIHAGAVEVRGLITNKGTGPFSISPLNNLYQAVGLAYPPFHEGDTVHISAAGSEFSPSFALEALGFAPRFGMGSPRERHPFEHGCGHRPDLSRRDESENRGPVRRQRKADDTREFARQIEDLWPFRIPEAQHDPDDQRKRCECQGGSDLGIHRIPGLGDSRLGFLQPGRGLPG
jgi:hypothetical protein